MLDLKQVPMYAPYLPDHVSRLSIVSQGHMSSPTSDELECFIFILKSVNTIMQCAYTGAAKSHRKAILKILTSLVRGLHLPLSDG